MKTRGERKEEAVPLSPPAQDGTKEEKERREMDHYSLSFPPAGGVGREKTAAPPSPGTPKKGRRTNNYAQRPLRPSQLRCHYYIRSPAGDQMEN